MDPTVAVSPTGDGAIRAVRGVPGGGSLGHHQYVTRAVPAGRPGAATRPIKGARSDSGPDQPVHADELVDDKDQAENVMIIDLLRIGVPVLQPGACNVPDCVPSKHAGRCGTLVSEVTVSSATARTSGDCSAAFPSITGAPQVHRHGDHPRGFRHGPAEPLRYDVLLRLNRSDGGSLIRTFAHRRGWIQCPVRRAGSWPSPNHAASREHTARGDRDAAPPVGAERFVGTFLVGTISLRLLLPSAKLSLVCSGERYGSATQRCGSAAAETSSSPWSP